MKRKTTLRLILGDQLNHEHSWLAQPEDNVVYVIAELKQESEYTTHHIQKQVAFFLAMMSFAKHLRSEGHHVDYLDLDRTECFDNLTEMLTSLLTQYGANELEYQRPDEFRLRKQLMEFDVEGVTVTEVDTEHFLLPFSELSEYFHPEKHVVMEHFYRKMRKRFGVLMEDERTPLGGKWNYDAENRSKLKKKDVEKIPSPLLFANPTSNVIARIDRHHLKHIGEIGDRLIWPVDRPQSISLLTHFCQVCLPFFGQFQDAMTADSDSMWSLYHSRLSFALNCKLLSPHEVIDCALETYHRSQGAISLAQIEGFIRQILGWREYVRGMYWANMPHYREKNALNAVRPLPNFYWTAKTNMRCMQHAISQSLEWAYAHHIQRLMVIGNFALLTELHPSQVDDWYLGIYIDAIEWVEMPNTRGMALYADGGLIATKPYCSSGNYINKMSDYCADCHYDVKARSGKRACPFNGFYWRFMHKHRDSLATNPRTAMIYRTWDRMAPEVQDEHLVTAEFNLNRIDQL